MPETATIVDGDRVTEIPARTRDGRLLVDAADLEQAIGWDLRPEGLCRGDVCVPVRDRAAIVVDDAVDVGAVSAALRRPFAFEPDAALAVVGDPAEALTDDLATLRAPGFTLPDVEGNDVSLDDFRGRKRLLLAWASWCGCRWDLPAWQSLYEELEPHGLTIIAISLDEDPEIARQCARDESPVELTYPIVVDRDHRVAELNGITNVPTTVWIDEDDQIVRPPAIAPGDDQFKDFTKIESQLHHDALRRWVVDGVTPLDDEEIRERQRPATPELQAARAERRLAVHLLRAGHEDAAQGHLARAIELAPDDWTINRGSMPLRGQDPFGQDFFDFYEAWEAKGRPGYES